MTTFNLPMMAIELAPKSLIATIPSKLRVVALRHVHTIMAPDVNPSSCHASETLSDIRAWHVATKAHSGACTTQTCSAANGCSATASYSCGFNNLSCSTAFKDRHMTATNERMTPYISACCVTSPNMLLVSPNVMTNAPMQAKAMPPHDSLLKVRPSSCCKRAVVTGVSVPMTAFTLAPTYNMAWLLKTTDNGKLHAIGRMVAT
mmetsp:Transcript_9883/g.26048  ORF Transcript_9883/g.26048 Transcript_9883/m.26048 type:complete len:204 (+) Transcript_9883:477-1088(+)